MGRSIDVDDPLAAAIAPPPDETPDARAARERAEAEARRVNDEIDEMLRAERTGRRRKKPVKVLLLGQSESGKSTTLKNFQLTYARKAWQEERESWRAVIQLNLLRSITLILDLLAHELDGPASPPPAPALDDIDEPDLDPDLDPDAAADPAPEPEPERPQLTETHKLLRLRLAPLRRVQADLERRLGAGAAEPTPYSTAPTLAAPFAHARAAAAAPEFAVRSTTGWRGALDALRPRSASSAGGSSREEADARARASRAAADATAVIAGCADDMRALWADAAVRALLAARRVRPEDRGGFFLDDLARVACAAYAPSDDDVVRARLRTLGAQEHRFVFERGAEAGQEWLMYDVGGARTLRAAWAPFFDDVHAVIFLAPISCFDEKLAEDRRVNRLEDSFLLWKAVCANKLLARTQLILFLNKCDLLERKLLAGVRVRDYVPSFGDRSNSVGTVAKYLRQKFRDISKQYSPEPRPFYAHLTSVIDTKATAITLGAVREGILRDHLRGADFI